MSAKTEQLDPLVRAKTIVFRMLNIRPRSEQEIRDRLRQKNLSAGDVDRTVQYFKELELVNDREFARQWISSRLRKPLGPHRIRLELRRKGIAEELIETELPAQLSTCPEIDTIKELINRREHRYENLEPVKRRRRLMDFLQRRGFSLPQIIKAMNDHDS